MEKWGNRTIFSNFIVSQFQTYREQIKEFSELNFILRVWMDLPFDLYLSHSIRSDFHKIL